MASLVQALRAIAPCDFLATQHGRDRMACMTVHGEQARFEPLSESALLVHFKQCLDVGVNARVHALCAAVRAADLPGIDEVTPAYASALVRFDPDCWAGQGGGKPHAAVRAALETVLDELAEAAPEASPGRLHQLPVCYGGTCGADLDAVAEYCGLSVDEVIQRHCAPEYRVAMLGFAPGFAYLLGLDPALEMPRRDQPRTRVPAGSIAIGGAQTGIYPRQLPGGWQLLGRTPATLFDADNGAQAALLEPGDRVRFVAISEAEFAQHSEPGNA